MVPDVTLAALAMPGADRQELRRAAEQLLHDELGATAVFRLCPHCGSDAHGRPGIRLGNGPSQHVSLSYAEGLVVLAWTFAGPVGVDVEVDGPPVGDYGDRREWTRTEAVLKATGEGLLRDPTTLRGDEAWTAGLPLADPWVGAVAVLGVEDARISWRGAGPAATPG